MSETRLEIEQECANDFRKIYERTLEIQKNIASEKTSKCEKKESEEKVELAV